jgi:ribosomal protein S18 acetylase RimI-like enzyme
MVNNYLLNCFDSKLFGFNVANTLVDNLNNIDILKIMNKAKSEGVKLLYYVSKTKLQGINAFINHRIMFEKNVVQNMMDIDKFIYQDEKVSDDLNHLAMESGLYSRFAQDKKLGQDNFKKMYQTWIRNLIKNNNQQQVLIIQNKKIAGFIAVSNNNNIGKIELIAVDKNFQNKGYGQKLLKIANTWFYKNSCHKILVGTQFDNDIAINFYKKNGFIEKYQDFAHHIWL